jgi:hypothetical protein
MGSYHLSPVTRIKRAIRRLISRISSRYSSPVANFFWDGPEIPLWSKACIHSFKNNGFKVIVYSYSDTLKDEFSGTGITVADAEKICEKSFRDKLFNAAKPDTYGKTYACFTDFFRLRLLSQRPGTWWFDTDIFCINNAKKFKDLERSNQGLAICGFEDPPTAPTLNACNAILWFGDKNFAKKTFDNLVTTYPPFKEHAWKWAQTAIPYLNDTIQKHTQKFNVQSRDVFYPLSWQLDEISVFMLPEYVDKARAYCNNSLTLHFWNEVFRIQDISRNQLPPEGSFLHQLITDNLPAAAAYDRLDIDSLREKLSENT